MYRSVKFAVRIALPVSEIIGVPVLQKFGQSLTMPAATCPEFLMDFSSD